MRNSITPSLKTITLFAIATALCSLSACAQNDNQSVGSNLRMVKIESRALSWNLVGDPSLREMAVLLPPSYFRSSTARFPTVYYLHGLGKRKDGHLGSVDMLTKLYALMKEKNLHEMIIVAVDGTTVFGGS